MAQDPKQRSLTRLRKKIDVVDRAFLRLLAQRCTIAERIGSVKLREGLPIVQPTRSVEMMQARRDLAEQHGLDERVVDKLFTLLQNEAIRIQRNIFATAKKRPAKKQRN